LNNPVIFTATVTGGSPPSGTVTFKDGATPIGTAVLDANSMAKFTTSTLTLGSHSITAVYAGDAIHSASASSVLAQRVDP
jgi:hypothetical protein